MPLVRYATLGLAGRAPAGVTLHEAVRGLGHVIDLACGGKAACSSCCVLVVEGEELVEDAARDEREQLARCSLAAPPWRLSCQARLRRGDAEVVLVAC